MPNTRLHGVRTADRKTDRGVIAARQLIKVVVSSLPEDIPAEHARMVAWGVVLQSLFQAFVFDRAVEPTPDLTEKFLRDMGAGYGGSFVAFHWGCGNRRDGIAALMPDLIDGAESTLRALEQSIRN